MCERTLKTNRAKEDDPTRAQARNRKSAEKKINQRLRSASRDVKVIFNDIPRTSKRVSDISLNRESMTVYDYDISAFGLGFLEDGIQRILDEWLVGIDEAAYYQENTEFAYRGGMMEALRDINQELITAAIAGALAASLPRSINVETYILSPDYQKQLELYLQRGTSEIKSLSKKTADQVYQVINSGLLAGKTPTDITKEINKRFKVAESNAKRIVHTEINRAYNDANIDAIVRMNELGIPMVGEHLSALLPTTRKNHAARHEKFYTAQQQANWWSEGANRINCYCKFIPRIKINKG